MGKIAALTGELDQCYRLVEDALVLVKAALVLEGSNRENLECLLERAAQELKATKLFVHAMEAKSPEV